MFKLFAIVVLALACTVSAKPQVAFTAPGVVTASSSQFIARNYNGLAAAPLVAAAYTAPVAAAYTAPVAAAYAAPYASYASYYPYNAAAAYTTYF